MSNSTIFKKAHRYTKATIQTGDNYQVNFGQWLKVLNAQQKALNNLDLNALLAVAKTGAKSLLADKVFQDVCQAGVSHSGRIQSVDFNEFLAADISDYDADKFLTAIISDIEFELAGRNGDFTFNANSAFRESLQKLSRNVLGKTLFAK